MPLAAIVSGVMTCSCAVRHRSAEGALARNTPSSDQSTRTSATSETSAALPSIGPTASQTPPGTKVASPAVIEPPLEHEKLPDSRRISIDRNAGGWAFTYGFQTAVPGLPGAAPSCSARGQSIARQPNTKCADASSAWSLLADALELTDTTARDRQLWHLEACPAFAPGLMRALRAELDPNCGDVIAKPFLKSPSLEVTDELIDALAGLAQAARLHRAITPLTPFKGPPTLDGIDRYRTLVLVPWRDAQLARLSVLGAQIQGLVDGGYGKTQALIALAQARHDLARRLRAAPIPDAIRRDSEMRTRYYSGIDDETAKVVKDNAALDAYTACLASRQGNRRAFVGLESSFASILSRLKLPVPPAYTPQTPKQRAAHRLPAYFAGLLLSSEDISDARIVRGLIDNGLSIPHRRAWAQNKPTADVAELLAYARVRLARHTSDVIHFDEALFLLSDMPERVRQSPELQLLRATATAGRTGPRTSQGSGAVNAHITQLEALRVLAASPVVTSVKIFAVVNQALFQLQGADDAGTMTAYRLLYGAYRAAERTDIAPCVEEFDLSGFGHLGKRERNCAAQGGAPDPRRSSACARPERCTLADRP